MRTDEVVLTVLRDAGLDGGAVTIAHDALAAAAGLSRRRLQKIIARLVAAGRLERARNRTDLGADAPSTFQRPVTTSEQAEQGGGGRPRASLKKDALGRPGTPSPPSPDSDSHTAFEETAEPYQVTPDDYADPPSLPVAAPDAVQPMQPTLPGLEVRRLRGERRVTMPEPWLLTATMRATASRHAMDEATTLREFEQCHSHHASVGSRFTPRGWAGEVWTTWVLRWRKGVPGQRPGGTAADRRADLRYLDEGIEFGGTPR